MTEHTLYTVLTLLAMSIAAVIALKRLNLPPALAYLFVGIAVGPHAIGLLENALSIQLLAEIGVVFLLFSIGLEFSLAQLLAMKMAVLGLGGAQVLLTTIAGMGVAHVIGLDWRAAIVVGGAIALSSTAIVTKQLIEQLEIQDRHGRLALGALLFQDLAVIPFLAIIPALADHSAAVGNDLLLALGKAVGAFIVMLILGRRILRPVFHTVATARSAELFTLTVLFIALLAGGITHILGLSAAMGAFLAGIMLGESEYRLQIEIDIRPFRDIFMGLFFITIGMQLDTTILPTIWLQVLLFVVMLIAGKGLLVLIITRVMGYEGPVATRTALVLAQGGEFSFALLTLALNRGLLDTADSQAILAATIISMMIAPILIKENGRLAKSLHSTSYLKQRQHRAKNIFNATRELNDHVIVIGYGRIGQNLALFLRNEGIDFVALDTDPLIVREAYETGERIYYGDATHVDLLRAIGIKRARIVMVTVPEARAAERIIKTIRSRNRKIVILVRSIDESRLDELTRAGASQVVPETLEASMTLATHMLEVLGVSTNVINQRIDEARADRYHKLRGYFHGEQAERFEDVATDRYRQHTVVLTADSYAAGATLQDLRLHELNVSVLAVRRGNIRGDAPLADMRLQAGDALLLEGSAEQLQQAEEILLSGP